VEKKIYYCDVCKEETQYCNVIRVPTRISGCHDYNGANELPVFADWNEHDICPKCLKKIYDMFQ
jgi:hypothetical protein